MAEISDRTPLSISFRDVLGYVVPGAAFLLIVGLSDHLRTGGGIDSRAPVWSLARQSASTLPNSEVLQAFLLIGAVILGGYVVGHVVASISTLLIERLLVSKGYGWPVNQLLGRDNPEDDEARKFYRGLFAWGNGYLFVRYVDGPMDLWGAEWLLVVMESVLTFLLAMKVLKWTSELRIATAMIGLICIPYDKVARIVARVMGTRDALPTVVTKQFETQFDRHCPVRLGDLSKEATGAYWFPYMYLLQHAPYLVPTLNHWRTLYVFCRNLSTALFLAAAYVSFGLAGELEDFRGGGAGELSSALLWTPLVLYVASMLMLLRYYYLFSCRYTRLVVRGFLHASASSNLATKRQAQAFE